MSEKPRVEVQRIFRRKGRRDVVEGERTAAATVSRGRCNTWSGSSRFSIGFVLAMVGKKARVTDALQVSAHCEAQICRTVWRTLSRKQEDGGGSASVKVPGPRALFLASRSAISFPWWPRCPAIQKSWSCQGIVAESEHHEMGWWRARRRGTRLVQLGNRKQKLF